MSTPLAQLLRTHRNRLGLSQFEMSMRLGVSQRHLSFIESARAQPSRALLLAWLQELRADFSLRNAALLHAGFAPVTDAAECRDESQRLAALRQMLAAHHPNAALIFDADWMIVEVNDGARFLCGLLMPGFMRDQERNTSIDMLAAVAHPGGLFSHAIAPEHSAARLLAQLHAESWARPSLQSRVEKLADDLKSRYRLPDRIVQSPSMPYMELSFQTPLGTLSFLLAQTVMGLMHDVTVGTLRTELWFPADAATAEVMRHRCVLPAA
jgi:transcriptional regulator with XRE-family HTH domain